MTSLLRRKRQITVRSTPAATAVSSPRGCNTLLITAVLALATCLTAISAALAEDQGLASATPALKKAAPLTIHSGGKLKWLPYRPQSQSSAPIVTQTQHLVPGTPTRPAKVSKQIVSSAFDDPFGEKSSLDSAQSSDVPEEPSTAATTGPSADSTLPDFPNQGTSTKSNSLLSPEKKNGLPGMSNYYNSLNNQGQTLEQALTAKHLDLKDSCPSHKDLKQISQLSTNITPSQGDLPQDCPWGDENFQPRAWAPVTFAWTASGLCHKPLYFEDVQLERYGHMLGPWVQPFASGAHFFLTVPILPYKMGLELPHECMYTLGYYRPGSCAPYMLDPLPLSIRGALFEAGAWVGGVAIIP